MGISLSLNLSMQCEASTSTTAREESGSVPASTPPESPPPARLVLRERDGRVRSWVRSPESDSIDRENSENNNHSATCPRRRMPNESASAGPILAASRLVPEKRQGRGHKVNKKHRNRRD